MDIVSHGLMGLAVKKNKVIFSKESVVLFLFGILPDLFQIPLYAFVGYIHNRFLWIPENSDWFGFRELYPIPSMLREIPHSFFFLILILLLLVLFKQPKIYALPYVLHLFIDIFTHSGEWATKPFFPLNINVQGFTDAWLWSWHYYLLSWLIIVFTLFKIKLLKLR